MWDNNISRIIGLVWPGIFSQIFPDRNKKKDFIIADLYFSNAEQV